MAASVPAALHKRNHCASALLEMHALSCTGWVPVKDNRQVFFQVVKCILKLMEKKKNYIMTIFQQDYIKYIGPKQAG